MSSTATMTVTDVKANKGMNLVPTYEIKLQLDPTVVLDADHKLNSTVQSTFGMSAAATRINVGFLDTSCTQLFEAGWCVRVRRVEGEPSLDLTYKKRFDIVAGDIDAALTTANANGFNASDKKYEARVECRHKKETLTVRRIKEAATSDDAGVDLPSTRDSRRLLREEAPERFDNWGCKKWGTAILAAARIFGPVMVRRSIGDWKGMKLYVEVWPILDAEGTGLDYIVEASFKTDNRATAAAEQSRLQEVLMSKGWFLAGDMSKTQLIMERYGCYPGLENTDLKEC